ncbi:MAG: DUF1513 domain-containing protein [Pseudomonadota bacterium]
MQDRRGFLVGLGAAALAPGASWADMGHPVALTAAKTGEGHFALIGLRADGSVAFRQPLPARGHAAAAHPFAAEAVHIARRPGTFALVIDCAGGRVLQQLKTPADRHFYGHAAFTADGTYLLTTENDLTTGRGIVGIWDRRKSYQRVAEVPSGGVGPHEIIRLDTGGFAVANGGIRTHPATGRAKLNLGTMRPNLTFMDASAQILGRVEGPDRLNSLRHIAALPGGEVLCGFQWQGDVFEAPPLLALCRGGQLDAVHVEERMHRRLMGYIGSVAASGADWTATAPRGGIVLSVSSGKLQTLNAPDGCGVAMSDGQTLITDGLGHVHALASGRLDRRALHPVAFDNHLVRV